MIETIEALYRPDMYEYQIDMVRESGRWEPAPAAPAAFQALLRRRSAAEPVLAG